MKENKIKPKGDAVKSDIEVNGLKATLFRYDATDEDGDTILEFLLIPANKRVVLITLWGSEAERDANKADIMAIESSLKPIN